MRPDTAYWFPSPTTRFSGEYVLIIGAMPAFNEEKFIAKTILGTRKHVDRVIVIDDGSSDATGEIAEALGALVVKHPENQGYGGALRTIFETARNLHADRLIIIDSDGQHDPGEIPDLLGLLDAGADIVIGSRFVEEADGAIPSYRKFGMKVLDLATNMAGSVETTDSQSGFRAYGKRAIDSIKVSGNGMSAGSEILIQAREHNLRVAETPINVRYDIGDTSTQHPLLHGLSVLGIVFEMACFRNPLVAFFIPGAIITLLGFSMGAHSISEYLMGSSFPILPGLASVILINLGLFLVNSGLVLKSLVIFLHTMV
ncbi:glycosyltransferase family 2 protein [Methanoculleus sp. 7T]|jgi:glycosyltransferase involved in cell wall biosynthesis|uniref:glycosyltransferase family 2 protein n=1 Tax=Methanoculleus sp. 7T TaxID=2937282 RepID=UPI0020C17CB0|nr:glycosyltransferase family 2 protein [Methanoculleus sp. 7T]MCK8517924.1 glycosyltransferase family 2 protein [Methanoculleus sp. 7T]